MLKDGRVWVYQDRKIALPVLLRSEMQLIYIFPAMVIFGLIVAHANRQRA